jgi:hypothetical protein
MQYEHSPLKTNVVIFSRLYDDELIAVHIRSRHQKM